VPGTCRQPTSGRSVDKSEDVCRVAVNARKFAEKFVYVSFTSGNLVQQRGFGNLECTRINPALILPGGPDYRDACDD
jgi:hypothetical protein